MMDEKKIIINTQGGPVINGGTFTNVEFVANKYVVESRNNSRQVVEAEVVDAIPADETKEMKRSSGRTPESLFKDRKGKKDDAMTQEKAAAFIEHLKTHQCLGLKVDTSKGNAINQAFVCFYKKWMKENLVAYNPNGNACFRFLQDDCGLTMDSTIKTYANFIRELIANSVS